MYKDYLALTKPRVVSMMLLTAWIGMLLACPPWTFPGYAMLWGTLGIACSAGSAAVINQLIERHIDLRMKRTQHRPVASGRIRPRAALLFAILLGSLGLGVLVTLVNWLTALLTLLSLIGYAFVYTVFLKRTTPQNIVIGGIAGAAPPLLGWTAVSGTLDPFGLLLVLIIFIWTPPHFWALALYRQEEYAKTDLPMLPVTHGVRFTKFCILLYIILLLVTTLLPCLTSRCGLTYGVCALGLGMGFLYYGVLLFRRDDLKIALQTFAYSIVYLIALFAGLLLDHYLQYWLHL